MTPLVQMSAAIVAFVAAAGSWPATADEALKTQIVLTYARQMSAAHDDALAAAKDMKDVIAAFIADPSAERLEKAKSAWCKARGPYLLTEVGRFYGGPIDDARNLENRINPWPIDEAYIESTPGSPIVGLIDNEHDHPEFTSAVLAGLNARDGEKNISCGWHAVEFLLWGRDTRADGPGQRAFTDFTTAPRASRRKAFLQAVVALLVDDLGTVAGDWRTGNPTNYRARFEAAPVDESLGRVFTGLYQLSGFEMASERIAVALETRAQEDEPDCFSDTTAGDFYFGVRAFDQVWRGIWPRVAGGEKLTGTGLRAFVDARNPEMATLIDEKIAASLTLSQKLPAPFDQVILAAPDSEKQTAWREFGEALEAQADLLAHFAKKEGIDLQFEHIDAKTR